MRGEQQPAEKLYSATEVCAALKLSRQTFDAWTLRGHLELPKGPGTGRTRLLTFEQVMRVATLDVLTRQGMTIGSAVALLDSVGGHFNAAIRNNDGDGFVMVIEDGKAQIGAISGKIVQELKRSTQVPVKSVFSSMFYIGNLVTRVRNALDANERGDGSEQH